MLEDYLNQKATYWIGEPDGFGGYTWSEPTTIEVRWQQKREKTKDDQGEEVVSNDQIWTMVDIPFNAKLYNGETAESNPDNLNGTYDVVNKKSRTDIDGNNDGYKVWL